MKFKVVRIHGPGRARKDRMHKPSIAGRTRPTCLRTRLAETAVATIDYCQCGHMHLNLGPFSIRLSAEALSGLMETIGEAMAAHDTTTRDVSTTVQRTPSWRRGGDA